MNLEMNNNEILNLENLEENTKLEIQNENNNQIIKNEITKEELNKEELNKEELNKEELELKKQKIKKFLKIKEKINFLNKNEYYEIYKIIKKNNETFSSNKNGIMFDLLKIKEETIEKINNFLKYLNDKKIQINNDDFNRHIYKELVN